MAQSTNNGLTEAQQQLKDFWPDATKQIRALTHVSSYHRRKSCC
jgi:hypothetical protein